MPPRKLSQSSVRTNTEQVALGPFDGGVFENSEKYFLGPSEMSDALTGSFGICASTLSRERSTDF